MRCPTRNSSCAPTAVPTSFHDRSASTSHGSSPPRRSRKSGASSATGTTQRCALHHQDREDVPLRQGVGSHDHAPDGRLRETQRVSLALLLWFCTALRGLESPNKPPCPVDPLSVAFSKQDYV